MKSYARDEIGKKSISKMKKKIIRATNTLDIKIKLNQMIRDEIEEKTKSKVNQIAIKRIRTKFDTKDK
jgi:hypothetical protein